MLKSKPVAAAPYIGSSTCTSASEEFSCELHAGGAPARGMMKENRQVHSQGLRIKNCLGLQMLIQKLWLSFSSRRESPTAKAV
jgi:hypothetical protein